MKIRILSKDCIQLVKRLVLVFTVLRLGANSLLDLVVFGRGTGKNIVEKFKTSKPEELNVDNEEVNRTLEGVNNMLDDSSEISTTGDIREEMQESMQTYASVYKSSDLLKKVMIK